MRDIISNVNYENTLAKLRLRFTCEIHKVALGKILV